MPFPLTVRQGEVYGFVRSAILRKGVAPSHEEIAKALGVSAIATVHKHLVHLERKGYIARRRNTVRGITLLTLEGTCPHCGQTLPVSATSNSEGGERAHG